MSFNPFQGPSTWNPFAGEHAGFGITGNDTSHIYGFGTGNAGDNGHNTLGARLNQTVFRDPLSRYVQQHTSGWLQDPGAALVHIMGGPGQPAPNAPPPQLQQLQSTPGAADPAGNVVSQMRAAALRKPQRSQQLNGGAQVNFGPGGTNQQAGDGSGTPYPVV